MSFLAVLFTLAVAGSLFTSGLLFFEVLPGSPLVMLVVGGTHAVFAGVMFYGYGQYRAMHMLVLEGRGELFEMAITARIGTPVGGVLGDMMRAQRQQGGSGALSGLLVRLFVVDRPGRQGDGDSRLFAGLKEHYRLRRVQGLQLSGLPHLAILASERLAFTAGDFVGDRAHMDLAATLSLANLETGRAWWAKQQLGSVADEKGAESHRELRVARARLAIAESRYDEAVQLISPLCDVRHFPFTKVLRARNRLWCGDALAGQGDQAGAEKAYGESMRAAPRSYWAGQAKRRSLALRYEGAP